LALAERRDPRAAARLKKLGFEAREVGVVQSLRVRLLGAVDRRWLHHYERALQRYGRGMSAMRGRVCQGCFITLPTSAAPNADECVTLCESCGRILYWCA